MSTLSYANTSLVQWLNEKLYVTAGVGKVRPTKAFCTARGVAFYQRKLDVFHLKCNYPVMIVENVALWAQNFIETARKEKNAHPAIQCSFTDYVF